jgi:hypothetical protein
MMNDFNEDEFKESFANLAARNENIAFQLIAGMFVGFLEYLTSENGGDKDNEIKVEAIGGRNITIHPVNMKSHEIIIND